MERKTAIGLAAVAAVGLLLYMRKQGASAATAGTGGVLTSNAAALNAAMGNAAGFKPASSVNLIFQNKPQPVSDAAASSPAPAPAPAREVAGPVGDESAFKDYSISKGGKRTYADGSGRQLTKKEQHVIDLQRKGKMPTFGM